MHPIIPQIIGLAAVATFLLSYQQKTRKAIITLNVISRVLYIVQYLLLGAISGAVLDVLGAITSAVAEKKDSGFIAKHKKAIFISIYSLIVAVGLTICIINRNLFDLLSLAGVLLHTGAFWMTNEKAIRCVSLLGSPCWLAYNLSSRAYGSAIGDVLTIISIITAMIRYGDFKTKNKDGK